MSTIRFFNTMTRQVEEFEPLQEERVGLYTCGPTVYDYSHIGNLRTFLFEDILRRTLEANGFRVTQVMNLTDVDDKTIRESTAAGLALRDYTERYIEAFFEDLDTLRVLDIGSEAPFSADPTTFDVRAYDSNDNQVAATVAARVEGSSAGTRTAKPGSEVARAMSSMPSATSLSTIWPARSSSCGAYVKTARPRRSASSMALPVVGEVTTARTGCSIAFSTPCSAWPPTGPTGRPASSNTASPPTRSRA